VHKVLEGDIPVGSKHLGGNVGQGVEGVEVGRCGGVPVKHGEGVVIGGIQVLPAYRAGDISDNGPGWSSVVEGMLEGVAVA